MDKFGHLTHNTSTGAHGCVSDDVSKTCMRKMCFMFHKQKHDAPVVRVLPVTSQASVCPGGAIG